MSKFVQEHAVDGEWTRPIYPVMDKYYKMGCCDCGLVHDMDFSIERVTKVYPDGSYDTRPVLDDSLKVVFRCRRNNRSTGQMRRKKHPVATVTAAGV